MIKWIMNDPKLSFLDVCGDPGYAFAKAAVSISSLEKAKTFP